MKEETNGRNLPSKVRCGFLLTGLLVAMGVAARAQGRPDAASGGCPEAAANPARVAPAEVPGLWAQVFPEGTSAAGLAEETADGGSLKLVVPKGALTTFRFLNPDGGETTTTWNW